MVSTLDALADYSTGSRTERSRELPRPTELWQLPNAFRLQNGPSIFQRVMQKRFGSISLDICFIYIEILLISP